jgi:hypothetical protein
MAISKTTYLELNKPDYDAVADIEVLNDNSDIIDEQFDGTHLVTSVNGVTPTGGAVDIDLGVTSVNGMTGAVTITERSVKQLIDIIYPVGTYYETTDATFNPNTAWAGTTWQKITDGRVLIAGGDEYTVGSNYGEKTHKITTAEMPVHNHPAAASNNGNHTHSRGSMNITGYLGDIEAGNSSAIAGGAFYVGNFGVPNKYSQTPANIPGFGFDASRTWTGETSWNGDHSHAISIGNSGSGTAMNMLQPSKAVARWLRTA